MMFKEYILEKSKKYNHAQAVYEDIPTDACAVLRSHGIKIKYTNPHENYLEIALYQDPESINLKFILKGFQYIVRDSKIMVKYQN